jgi:hypothetical protein
MLWKSALPDDLARLIESARARAVAALAAVPEDDDWDEDLEAGPEVIYVRGEGDAGDDDGDDDDSEQ